MQTKCLPGPGTTMVTQIYTVPEYIPLSGQKTVEDPIYTPTPRDKLVRVPISRVSRADENMFDPMLGEWPVDDLAKPEEMTRNKPAGGKSFRPKPTVDTSVGLARLSHKRLTNWLSVAEGFTAQQSPPAVQWLQVLGHLVSLEKLVPYGRIAFIPFNGN